MSKEREDIRQGWYYVKLPEGTEGPKLIQREDGVVLDRRLHGAPGRVQVVDQTRDGLHPVTLMRAVAMLDAADEVVHVVLDEEETAASLLDDGSLLRFPPHGNEALAALLQPDQPVEVWGQALRRAGMQVVRVEHLAAG